MNTPAAISVLIFGLGLSGARAAEPPPIGHNPFDRPAYVAVVRTGDGDARASEPAPAIDLRSTMVGANTALADVGGRILRPGDTIGDATLTRVLEDRAIFLHNGRTVTVLVKPAPDESDE